jgi:hypothetical protein
VPPDPGSGLPGHDRRDLFGAIAFFIVYGILIALAWVRLEAVDVALAEAAIGAGLTGVLLIGAWSMLRRVGVPEDHKPSHGGLRLVAGIASGAVTLRWPRRCLACRRDARAWRRRSRTGSRITACRTR